MTHRTVVLSTFADYLACEDDSLEERAAQERDRQQRMLRFPHCVMLQVAFAEHDFADRWCWQHFGPRDGPCNQRQSEYPACNIAEPHSHAGRWTSHWFVKTDYDFGFNEWYFAEATDCEQFLANVANINWGERYPK